LPKLGFGLWRMHAVTIALELALVVGGAWFYWRAARTVSAGGNRARAVFASVLILVFGLLVLTLDVTALSG